VDVSLPIRSVIPSLDGPVLHALSTSNAPASLSDLHRRTGEGSVSGVRRVLERMVEHGLVLREPGGYVLNREHLAADAVLLLTGLHGKFRERLRAWVGARHEPVVAVGLYGSLARRDGSVDSDVDLVLVTAAPTGPELREELSAAVEQWTGNRAQVVVLTVDEVDQLHAQPAGIVASWAHEIEMIVGDRSAVGL
jgi:predicted nucleotidyltransferase